MNLGHDLARYTGALTFKKPALPDLSCPDSTTQHVRDPPRSDDRCLRLSLLEVQAPEGNVGACARCATLGESLNLSGPQLLLGNPVAGSGSSPHPLPPTLREKHLPSPPTTPHPPKRRMRARGCHRFPHHSRGLLVPLDPPETNTVALNQSWAPPGPRASRNTLLSGLTAPDGPVQLGRPAVKPGGLHLPDPRPGATGRPPTFV